VLVGLAPLLAVVAAPVLSPSAEAIACALADDAVPAVAVPAEAEPADAEPDDAVDEEVAEAVGLALVQVGLALPEALPEAEPVLEAEALPEPGLPLLGAPLPLVGPAVFDGVLE